MSLPRGGHDASLPDLTAARAVLAARRTTAQELLERSLAAAHAPEAAHSFIRHFDAMARAAAQAVDAQLAAGAPLPPLAGLAVSVKDLFDVAGFVTSAGSKVLQTAAPATHDAPAVARLRAAGAALLGHTNLSEFAFSGVGLNPHHGTPVNPSTLAIDAMPRIPGGSTSGGAVSVACGAAWAALGSDTGGSIRIPAALQGLVGFKNTQRLTPLQGCVPLSFTLDTSCAITRSVRDAVLLHETLSARQAAPYHGPLRGLRLAVPRQVMLDDLEPAVAQAFARCLAHLSAQGAAIQEVALESLARVAPLQAQGGFAAAESWAWHRQRLQDQGQTYDPRVAARIRRGETISAADYIDLQRERRAWITGIEAAVTPYDALLSPTVPMVAPPIATLLGDDAAFFATNARLLRNPSVVNFLDGCALSLPCHPAGQMPVGLMIWGPAMSDDRILGVGLAVEAALAGSGG